MPTHLSNLDFHSWSHLKCNEILVFDSFERSFTITFANDIVTISTVFTGHCSGCFSNTNPFDILYLPLSDYVLMKQQGTVCL